jgi:hypothetical protein
MREQIKVGTILIKEGAYFPEALVFESQPYFPGWQSVTNLDGSAMDRKTREAGWTFFCLAGEATVTVFGVDEEKMVRKAVKRIVAKLSSQFNCLEITRVSAVSSRRFVGVSYITVAAHTRHIQEGSFLSQAVVHGSVRPGLDRSAGFVVGDKPHEEEIVAKQNVSRGLMGLKEISK